MASFPFTKDEIKEWISTTLGEEESISIEIITTVIDQNEIDGKLLLLLYKYPHEIQHLLPNLRARLLLMNALDVLVKAVVGEKILFSPFNWFFAILFPKILIKKAYRLQHLYKFYIGIIIINYLLKYHVN